jgi:anti-sigma factor RsiW
MGWRRKLTRDEQAELRAWLAAHPESQAEWESEAALNEFLGGLPDATVPSNFTARVLQEVKKAGDSRRGSGWTWNWRLILARAAVAALVLVAGVTVFRQHENNQRAQLARRVANVSDMVALSDPQVLQDFETVRHLNQTPAADEELLALLQ